MSKIELMNKLLSQTNKWAIEQMAKKEEGGSQTESTINQFKQSVKQQKNGEETASPISKRFAHFYLFVHFL